MAHRHRPRKRFGQNFLHDPGVIERIVRHIAPRPGQHLVEIGPGQGALTAPLLAAAGELEVVELDRDLIPGLRGLGSGIHIHQADALRFDFRRLQRAPDDHLRIVGNLPYNISTPLLFHLIEQIDCIADMHFMLQREVVERLAAGPGSKRYGRLSVMVQYHCAVEKLLLVGPGAFRPPPQVESAVVRLLPHARPPAQVSDYAAFAHLVNRCFAQRRKTLRRVLKDTLDEHRIRQAGIDPALRPENLSLAQFAALSELL